MIPLIAQELNRLRDKLKKMPLEHFLDLIDPKELIRTDTFDALKTASSDSTTKFLELIKKSFEV
jgi:hypothetical protein